MLSLGRCVTTARRAGRGRTRQHAIPWRGERQESRKWGKGMMQTRMGPSAPPFRLGAKDRTAWSGFHHPDVRIPPFRSSGESCDMLRNASGPEIDSCGIFQPLVPAGPRARGPGSDPCKTDSTPYPAWN